MKVVSVAEMRQLEAATEGLGLPGPALMEIAGRAVADTLVSLYGCVADRSVVVLCGPGHNGGDGLVAARWLSEAGARVVVATVDRRGGDDARRRLLEERGVPVVAVRHDWSRDQLGALLGGASLVVDALLGIGRARPIAGAMAATLAALAARPAGRPRPLVALDLPSGLDADDGRADPATPTCDATVTLGAVKRGLLIGDGPARAGRIVPVPIGLPASCQHGLALDWLDRAVVPPLMPRRDATGHKGTFGRALVVAGSTRYVGAPILSALGAARGGAGLVTLAAPGQAGAAAAGRLPEITHLPLPAAGAHLTAEALPALAEAAEGYRALVVGPGLGRAEETAALLRAMLAEPRLRDGPRWVVDADALTLLSRVEDWSARLPPDAILTPHPGEMARLLGADEVPTDRLAVALASAARWRAVVVLKGAYTVVAAPDGRGAVAPSANPALGSAGTGDVLTGAIAAQLAQGAEPFQAARVGVALHAAAGELARAGRGAGGVLAGDVADELPRAAELFRRGRDPWTVADR